MTTDTLMRTHCTALSLSDFLASVAAAEAANGMDINADVYRQRATQALTLETANQHMREELETRDIRTAEALRVLRGV